MVNSTFYWVSNGFLSDGLIDCLDIGAILFGEWNKIPGAARRDAGRRCPVIGRHVPRGIVKLGKMGFYPRPI
jgi:hypothetical protein